MIWSRIFIVSATQSLCWHRFLYLLRTESVGARGVFSHAHHTGNSVHIWMLGCIARRIAARSGMTNLDFGMLSVDGQLGDDAEATIR